ncbi:MAG: hypothetical protein PHR00_01105 [Patescibacteria group bacterium]|nr:hypothetical protein [Patescibacteria group bacterium]
MAYWLAIESLGGFVWSTKHDLGHGRIEKTASLEKELTEAQEILGKLASELSRFGIILPEECPQVKSGEEKPTAPAGKMWYWDWYNKMKTEYYTAEYEKIVCSACPLSEGVEEFISANHIPCSVFPGIIYHLAKPFFCTMVYTKTWDKKNLLKEIEKIGGVEAVISFEKKEAELEIVHGPINK